MPLVSEGPLTLECFCEGGAVTPCSMTSLELVVGAFTVVDLGFFAFTVGNGPYPITVSGTGRIGLTPVADWLAAMEGLTITLDIGRSTSEDTFGTGDAWCYILATYLCVDPNGVETEKTAVSFYRGGGQEICPDNGKAMVLGHFLVGQWWHSRPLADCTFISLFTSGGFTEPDHDPLGDDPASGHWCLCASGGTAFDDGEGHVFAPIYHFSIVSGTLPSGERLDPETGCILGTASGIDPGSSSITFRVLDVRSEEGTYADVTCGLILPGCAGPVVEPEGNFFIS